MLVPDELTACIICRDDRGFQLAQILVPRFQIVYWMSSDSDCRKFTPLAPRGEIVSRKSLPTSFHAVFFHSGNDTLWQRNQFESQYTFEFNTPGTPSRRDNVLPIFRATGNYFGIRTQDIDEVVAYMTGETVHRPSMCFPSLEVLPALSLLCQAHLANLHPNLAQPTQWITALGTSFESLQEMLETEWQLGYREQSPKSTIEQLLAAIFSESQLETSLVQSAYTAIAHNLGHSAEVPPLQPFTTQADSLAIFTGSLASCAIATLTSWLCNIPILMLKSGVDCPQNCQHLLILPESQIRELSTLRSSTYNFRGAVLVISSQSYPALKQKYRILCCGQRSHAALTRPWAVEALQEDIAKLIALQPENLRLWQLESQEFEQKNKQKIEMCQTQLTQLRQSAAPQPEILSTLETTVGQLRIQAKFACHTPIQLASENNARPIKDHLDQGIRDLQKPEKYNQAIERLEQVLSSLSQLLLSSVEADPASR